jgi:hypothetical protein
MILTEKIVIFNQKSEEKVIDSLVTKDLGGSSSRVSYLHTLRQLDCLL